MMKTVRVMAVKDKLVPDVHALAGNMRRFIGRKFNPETQTFDISGPVFVELCTEYKRALKCGDLVEVK